MAAQRVAEPFGSLGTLETIWTTMTNFVIAMRRHVLACLAAVLMCASANGQRVVTGTVTDASTGEALPGVTVVIQGTSTGTITTSDGRFSLDLPSDDAVIVFSFVGYRSQTVKPELGTEILAILLKESFHGLDELVVVGTRRLPRLVRDSAVPIDVLAPRDFTDAAVTDMDDVLRTNVPAYNVRRSGGDEASLVRPASLRGLPTDNIIVLFNGKRRHRSSSIALKGSALNHGSQGPDLNMIPSIAVKQVEILRDGASAQYGADAVAGVINMQLRDSAHGVLVKVQGGQYTQGDGRYGQIAANVGLHLTQRGYLNLSLEGKDVEPTVRSTQREDAALLATLGYPVADPAQIWGAPEIRRALMGFANAGLLIGNTTKMYAFGGFGQRTVEVGFFFRSPGTSTARSGVFRIGSGATATRAVLDLKPDDDIACRDLDDLPALSADNAAVQRFVADYRGQCFLFNEMFPGGFTPRFGSDMQDWSMVAGLKGGPARGLQWDVSIGIGRSAQDYYLNNTVNASYGPDTATSFRPRGYLQQEVEASADMSYPIHVDALASPLNVAWGVTWRSELFESTPGDLESYNPGPYAVQGFSVGSNGYQGLNPAFAGRWTRPNAALYMDIEADVTPRWVVDVAGRYENYYDNFGSTLTGKTAALFRATDRIAFRGTISTGFRAPTPGQANLNVFQTTGYSSTRGLIEVGHLPPTEPISMALGGRELSEERARNVSIGTVLELSDEATFTFDYYDIAFRNRIAVTGDVSLTPEMVDIMNEANLLGGVQNLVRIRFYTNDFDTRTRGTDLVLSWQRDWQTGQTSSASLAWNWTQQQLTDYARPRQITEFLGTPLQQPTTVSLLTPARRVEMETLNPKYRMILTGRHQFRSIHTLVRLNYYSSFQSCPRGSVTCMTDDGQSAIKTFDAALITAMELGYAIGRDYRVAIGVTNLLDTVPLAIVEETRSLGLLHPRALPWDSNGRSLYVRFTTSLL